MTNCMHGVAAAGNGNPCPKCKEFCESQGHELDNGLACHVWFMSPSEDGYAELVLEQIRDALQSRNEFIDMGGDPMSLTGACLSGITRQVNQYFRGKQGPVIREDPDL